MASDILRAERGIMENDVWLWLTRFGALTGFVAFVFKVWEFYRDRRPSLRMKRSLTSDPNTVLVVGAGGYK
jgi:hypothetical protein